MPFLLERFGTDRFGLLSFAFLFLGYFSFFDLGLGRATTKFFSQYLAEGRKGELHTLFWTSFLAQLGFACLGGTLLAVVVPYLIEGFLGVPQGLREEAREMFLVLGFTLPLAITSASLRGVLEASERFDLANYVRVPLNSSAYVLPLLSPAGAGIKGAMLLLGSAQLLGVLAYFVLVFRIYPNLAKRFRVKRETLFKLMGFGVWVTAFNLIIPAVNSLDRFLLGRIVSISAVTYFVVPYEVLARVQIIPSSLAGSLFPAFSGAGEAWIREVPRLYVLSTKCLLLVLAPLSLLLLMLGDPLLRVWLGEEFARESGLVFQFLVLGFFVNAVGSWVPVTLLLGFGRPDLVTKIFFLDLLGYGLLSWALISVMGILGASLAMAVRGLAEWGMFSSAAGKVLRRATGEQLGEAYRRASTGIGLCILGGALLILASRLLGWVAASLGLLLLLPLSLWFFWFLFDPTEIKHLSEGFRALLGPRASELLARKTRGSWRMLWYGRSKFPVLSLPIPCRTPLQGWMFAFPDETGISLLLKRLPEEKEQTFVDRFLRPGMVFIDVGANQGLYTFLAQRKVAPGGKVIAFEPAPPEFRKLLWNRKLHPGGEVFLEPLAVGAERGEGKLFLGLDGKGAYSSLRVPTKRGLRWKTVDVRVVDLDSYVEYQGLQRVDFIKIDVEGGELEVLRGARRILERHRPFVMCEHADVRTRGWGYSTLEIYHQLQNWSYQLFSVRPDGTLDPSPPRERYEPDWENLVGIPEEAVPEVLEGIR